MIRLEKFNFEGFPHVCNYLFEKKIYVIHGDYEMHLFSNKSNATGNIYLDDRKMKYKEFLLKHSARVLSDKNMISKMTIDRNFQIFKKSSIKDVRTFLSKYDYYSYSDQVLDKILAILRVVYIKKDLCIIEYNAEIDEVLEFIHNNNIADEIAIIILDKEKNISPLNQDHSINYVKYFQGYISNKIVD